MIALQTKGKAIHKETQPTPNDNNVTEQNILECTPLNVLDDDDDVLQLRVAALKSAVMKKYGERKKRGLLVKKRKRASSGFTEDITTSPENNLALEQDNSSPSSPAKSSTSLQGEEDMELAESDFEEDIIEEINASSVEEEPKLSEPVSCRVPDPSARTYEIPSTIHAHLRNLSLIVPPQPLPPGVDGDCPELINQSIFTSVIPPPPPPPSLVFSPILPPPPPPPYPSSSLESSPHFNQPPIFSNHTNSGSAVNNLAKVCPQKQSASTSNITFSDPPYEAGLKSNSPNDGEPSCNDELVVKKPKQLDTIKSKVRENLITVPVVENMSKPVLTKTQIRKRKRKRSKGVKVLMEPESSLLCITKPPGKSSVKLGGSPILKTVKQTNIQSGHEIKNDHPDINCTKYEGITPVILCNTNPPVDTLKDMDNLRAYEEIWQKQECLQSGMSSAKSNLCEANLPVIEDEIDLSEMIVLDEVGMSPEHKSKNEGNWDYISPQEDEDENTLRIRALTSLSPKPVVKKLTYTSEVVCPWPHIQPETPRTSWESNELGKSEYNARRGLINLRVSPKEVQNQRRVVGIDTSKYRLTRTLSNEQRRSVVHGRESLKVVVPTNSPPNILPSEPPLPVVKRMVINVDKDSDSEEECEWTRKIRIQDSNTTLPPVPIVDYELERSIDELLMRARNSVDYNSSPKQKQGGNARSATLKPENRKTLENDFSLHDTPLKLLPKDKQEEYKRLKAILERKERERQESKKVSSVRAQEKSKPLLQHVLINENIKQNQKGQPSPLGSDSQDDKRSKPDQCIDYGAIQNNNSNDLDTSSCTVKGPVKGNRQKNFSPDSSGNGNCSRKVIFNETNKLNINLVRKGSISSHEISNDEDLQCKVLKPTDKTLRMAKIIICENSDTNLNQRKSQEASQTKLVGSSSKQSSMGSSTNIMKLMQENLGSNMQQQTTAMLNVKYLQNDLDNAECSGSNELEPEKDISPKLLVMSQSNSKKEIHSSALEAPQILSAQDNNPSQEKTLNQISSLSDEEEERRGSDSTKVTKENEVSDVTLNDKIPYNVTKSPDAFEAENRINNFKKSQTNTLDADDVSHLVDEGGKEDPIETARPHMSASPTSLCSELEKQGEIKVHLNSNENSNSNKDNVATSFEGNIRSSDMPDDSHAAHQELLPNECPREELAAKKSELLSERFGLLDDLSEMAESLDDLDSHQGRLEQAAVEISALRRALRAAEDTLHEEVLVAESLERRLHDTHTAVSARCKNIAHLQMALHHASYEIPTTAQKLMSKKVKQVKEKIDKVKGKRNLIKSLINNADTTKEVTEVHANLCMRKTEESAPDNAEIIDNLWLQDPKTSQLEDFCVKKISADCDNKNDTETQTLSSSATDSYDADSVHLKQYKDDQQRKVHAVYSLESSTGITSEKLYSGEEIPTDAPITESELETGNLLCSGSNSSSIETVQPSKPHLISTSESDAISTKLKNVSQQAKEKHGESSEYPKEKFYKELCSLKRSITQVSDDLKAVAKKPNLTGSKITSNEIEHNVVDNARNLRTNESVGHGNFDKKLDIPCKSGSSRTSKSKLQYKSILQYRGPSSRVDKSPSGQAILCPYDLTGRCQDKECKFQHVH